ncbi:MAG: GntR family transcriptional regulator [Alphaproteobacteria bacterium]|nr:GntR family transcriptional regulator [Alphaproteobacteria bacterium]
MKPLQPKPGLSRQVYQSILDAMAEGQLAPGAHLVQERIAAQLAVSRHPVQQALAMLRNDGLVEERGKRGLFVAPLDLQTVSHRYQVRAALDGLAARLAAERARSDCAAAAQMAREGGALLAAGRAAIAKGSIAGLVQRDVAFHEFVYAASGNPLIAQTAAAHWRHMRRAMAAVLRHAGPPAAIWRQHESMLDAMAAGDADRAEASAVAHVQAAAERLRAAMAQPADGRTAGRSRKKPSPLAARTRAARTRSARSHA